VTPYGPASGSGIAVLRALPDAPLSNVDLIAFEGVVNAGDAGIRVSGNINLAAVAVINASNITVGGTATGVPTITAPNIGALTTASNTAGATQATVPAATGSINNNQASIIIVEVVGYGGGDGSDTRGPSNEQSPGNRAPRSYNLNSPVQVIGSGDLTAAQKQQLTAPEQKNYDDALR
jgi:Filamentous haemagglutinin family outer membrane protein